MARYTKFNLFGYLFFFISGLALGWFLFHGKNQPVVKDQMAEQENESAEWSCPMHPEVRQAKPGKCLKCGMDLVPLNQVGSSGTIADTTSVVFSNEAVEIADVLTSVVTRRNPEKEIRLYGKVQTDDQLKHNQTANISGRIENLMVYSTGEFIRKGQTLALIYSPEFVAAQQALLAAAQSKRSRPAVYSAAREKFLKWQMTDAQIDAIEKKDRVQTNIEVSSNVSGIVSSRKVNNGEYVAKGDVLYQITDLSKVWVVFNAYESDLPFLNKGDQISFSLKTEPGSNFTGVIAFIDPVLDAKTRAAKVRIEMDNPAGVLKPDMFVTGLIQANISQYRDKLIIPELSVIWTGKSSKVYVKQQSNNKSVFIPREVKLGPMIGNNYVVIGGLNEGDEIVTQGAYNVDAAANRQKSADAEE